MKKILLLFVAALSFVSLNAQTDTTQGIIFRNLNYEDALKAAAKENKLVFLHGYAEWCHYCHDMVEKIYPDSEVGAFFNSNFICIKMDLEKEGAELNKRLLSHTYPTLVFFDSKGTVMHRAAGRHMKPLLLQLGREAMDPRQQLYGWEKVFNNGACSPDTAYRFLRKMEIAGMNLQPDLLKYLAPLKNDQLKEAQNWKLINELYKDVNAPFMEKLISMKPELENIYTKPAVDKKFFDMYKYDFAIKVRTLDTAGYDKLKQQVRAGKLDMGDMIADYADLMRAKMKNDYEQYFTQAGPFVKKIRDK